MTLDGYTTAQLQAMYRVAFEDTSAALDRLHKNLQDRLTLPYPSPAHAVVLAQYAALYEAAQEKHEHMRALGLELERRYADADAADLDRIARTARQCLHSPN
jgi:hypothetical protein